MIKDLRIKEIEARTAEIRKQRKRERLNSRLKPCPFCGGKVLIIHEAKWGGDCYYNTLSVKCMTCGVRTMPRISDGYDGEPCSDEEIAEMWNRRVKYERS